VHKKYLLPLLLVAALSMFVLAACGGDSDDGGNADEEAIVTTIETSATSTDPADCEVYSTQAFLEQTEIVTGKAAVEACEEGAEDDTNNPDSVSVDAIEVNDGSATAEVAFEGGNFDGQTLAVSLVEEDGAWKLDQVESFVGFDRDAFSASFEESLEGAGLTSDQESCLQDAIDGADDGQLEELVISGSEEPLEELFGEC
jgi:hypothetical protein